MDKKDKCLETTNQITQFKANEKLKQWININLNEKIFYDKLNELTGKRFKKKTDANLEQIRPDDGKETVNQVASLNNELDAVYSKEFIPSEIFNKLKVKLFLKYKFRCTPFLFITN